MDLVYRKYKRNRLGACNICGTEGPLTWDHVPPKGGIELQAVEIERVMSVFVSGLRLERREISQNGLKYRTLCDRCNNDLLGARFDPALNDLAVAVGRFLTSNLVLPRVLHVEGSPNAVVRSVLGHLVAARLSSDVGLFDPLTLSLLENEAEPIPAEINVFYWIHPFAQQIVLRDALMPRIRGRYDDLQRFGLLKYFPLGFLATTAEAYEGLPALTAWRNEPSSFQVRIPIDLSGAKDAYWPEAPAPGNFLFGGHDLMESIRTHPKPELLGNVRRTGAGG